MCIRDRDIDAGVKIADEDVFVAGFQGRAAMLAIDSGQIWCCLLYTSDAADERSSVDLGGRRIIKKKTT